MKIKNNIIHVINKVSSIKFLIHKLGSENKIYISDKLYQNLDYNIFTGKNINFKNPTTFNDKLQWLKYYNRRPEYTQLVDKYGVRDFIAKTVGKNYLIPLLGIYKNFYDINFDKLPNSFILKCTHDSGTYVVC